MSARYGSWFQQRFSLKFCSSRTTSFAHSNTIESTWRHSSNPTSGWGTTAITWPTACLPRGCRSDNEEQFTKFIGICGCNHGLQCQCHTYPPTRSYLDLTHRHPTPHFCHVATSTCGVHITTDDVACSFVVLCAPYPAKISNYSCPSARTIIHDVYSSMVCMICVANVIYHLWSFIICGLSFVRACVCVCVCVWVNSVFADCRLCYKFALCYGETECYCSTISNKGRFQSFDSCR